MRDAWKFIRGHKCPEILLIADHASNHVPDDITLVVNPACLNTHIAIDLGVAALAKKLGFTAILGGVSRLVIDLNREADALELIPLSSDGIHIPGNHSVDAAERIARFWQPYHDIIAQRIAETQPKLLVSLHSFTPQLATKPGDVRPWEIGILYNQDDRAARIAIPLLAASGVIVGDQLPYSGKHLNATMNLHGEANGIAYLGIEMRQDLIADERGVDHWAALLSPVISACLVSG
jgi:predicted N-formylglutamate amidohydrolase